MKLEEKIMMLRKQKGWSQEELSYQLGVSRQAISKWESGASIPDLDKIISMSELFNVSTDYILKDDDSSSKESNIVASEEPIQKTVSKEEAIAYLDATKKNVFSLAFATFLCIISPITLIILGGVAEFNSKVESLVVGVGISVLFVIVGIAVAFFISHSMKMSKYNYLNTDKIYISNDLRSYVTSQKEAYHPTYSKGVVTAVLLYIFSCIPLFICEAIDAIGSYYVVAVGVLLIIVAIGTFIMVNVYTIKQSFNKLLQVKDYSETNKKSSKRISYFAGIYWLVITVIYLLISFLTNRWDTSWIVWAISGVLYGAIEVCFYYRDQIKK